ncbi:hypothetical protein [Haloarcula nitratireducens]|uniref:Lipoprotein n=1 Tax=Haloarcula nitratireducens TaxID=2487749 RepID=A0AAW4P6X8_9EURY|nr:hypothetical protein [Halomicroarcula nitratireducens]MBX0293508.1 hypothetical protein [Halomicroarcula nitratireducens]
MVPPTRRRVLHGAAGVAAALSGCGELLSGSDSSTRAQPTPTAGENGESSRGNFAGSESNPASLALRVDTDRPPVWFDDPDREGNGRPTPAEHGGYGYFHTNGLVDSADRAERVSVADVPNPDRIPAFFEATDFDSETVYVESQRVEECFRLELCSVSWSPDEVRTDYGRVSRPYDVRCEDGEKVFAVRLIRIPAALDAEEVTGYGSSTGAGSCGNRRARAEFGSSDDGDGETATADDDSGTPIRSPATPTEGGA